MRLVPITGPGSLFNFRTQYGLRGGKRPRPVLPLQSHSFYCVFPAVCFSILFHQSDIVTLTHDNLEKEGGWGKKSFRVLCS